MVGMTSELDDRLRSVCDRQEITDAVLRAARGADRGDLDLLRTAFHDGATVTIAPYEGPAEGMIGMIGGIPDDDNYTHFIGNQLVEVRGDAAVCESYFLAMRPYTDGDRHLTRTRCGRYVDLFERRNGQWRIAHRTLVDSWVRIDEAVDVMALTGPSGRRDRDDAVYRAISQLESR